MEFTELGFSSDSTEFELGIFSKFQKIQLFGTLTHPQIPALRWDSVLMTDRQCAKKILLKRNPDMTDDDVNKVVYGNDLRRIQGISYVPYLTDDEVADPSIISNDKSMADSLDSPYKPLEPTVELYEQIYQWKKQIKFDMMTIERSLLDLSDDRAYIKFLIDKASSFINLSALTERPTTTPLPPSNLTSLVTAPLNINLASLFIIIMESRRITKDNKRKINSLSQNFVNMPYIDFIIKPEKITTVYKLTSLYTTKMVVEKDKYNKIEKFLLKKQKLIEDAQKNLEEIDKNLGNLTIAQFITPYTGTTAAEVLYENTRQQYEIDKENLINDLIDSLKLKEDEIKILTGWELLSGL
jgi:hypothetical protein